MLQAGEQINRLHIPFKDRWKLPANTFYKVGLAQKTTAHYNTFAIGLFPKAIPCQRRQQFIRRRALPAVDQRRLTSLRRISQLQSGLINILNIFRNGSSPSLPWHRCDLLRNNLAYRPANRHGCNLLGDITTAMQFYAHAGNVKSVMSRTLVSSPRIWLTS